MKIVEAETAVPAIQLSGLRPGTVFRVSEEHDFAMIARNEPASNGTPPGILVVFLSDGSTMRMDANTTVVSYGNAELRTGLPCIFPK